MTLDEIKALDKEYLTPREVGKVIGCNPYAVSVAARTEPEKLGFPVIRIGKRTKIPKAGFVKFMEGTK